MKVSDFMKAVFSENGPPKSSTRLVLIALSQWADWDTCNNCYPSIESIASKCALSERAAKHHLRLAGDLGWIERIGRCKKEGKGRDSNLYVLSIPFNLSADIAPKSADLSADFDRPECTFRTLPIPDQLLTNSANGQKVCRSSELAAAVLNSWRNHLPEKAQPHDFEKWSEGRKKHFKARVNKDAENRTHAEWWENLFTYVENDCFCADEDARWFQFDWFLKSEGNLQKLIEGNYERK